MIPRGMRCSWGALAIALWLGVASCSAPAESVTPDPDPHNDATGGAGGKGGAGGQGGKGGTPGDASTVADAPTPDALAIDAAAPTPDADAATDTSTPGPTWPALPACSKPSVDRLETWKAHGGSLDPKVGSSLLVKAGDGHHAQVRFIPGSAWHEVVVPLAGSVNDKADLSKSKGLRITYSATADLWVQLRPLSHSHGGEQYTAKLPTTAGAVTELFLPFDTATWGDLLGKPPFPFTQAVRDASFFNFVGPPPSANTVVIQGLRIDGHVPPCGP